MTPSSKSSGPARHPLPPQAEEAARLMAEAKAFAAIWHRNRMVVSAVGQNQAVELCLKLMSYIPPYRQILLCGEVPKETKYLKGTKVIDSGEPLSQQAAFQISVAEEELGAAPIQIIYFGAAASTYRDVLAPVDRGWMIVDHASSRTSLEKSGSAVQEEIRFPQGTVFLLDPLPKDLTIERNILSETRHCSPGVREYNIQMKETEARLAFQAILAEMESGKTVTQSYLAETLKVREKTYHKILEIGFRERRLDLTPYIKETTPQVIEFLKAISMWNEASLAAIFVQKNLIGYAKYKDIDFPSLNFLTLSDRVEALSQTQGDPGHPWILELAAREMTILLLKHRLLYGFLLSPGADAGLFRGKLEGLIEELAKEEMGNGPSRAYRGRN
jgi:hypothetical protein